MDKCAFCSRNLARSGGCFKINIEEPEYHVLERRTCRRCGELVQKIQIISPESNASVPQTRNFGSVVRLRKRTFQKLGTSCTFWFTTYSVDGVDLKNCRYDDSLYELWSKLFCKSCLNHKSGPCLHESRGAEEWFEIVKTFVGM